MHKICLVISMASRAANAGVPSRTCERKVAETGRAGDYSTSIISESSETPSIERNLEVSMILEALVSTIGSPIDSPHLCGDDGESSYPDELSLLCTDSGEGILCYST